jgi:mycofactocin precursor
MTPGAARQEELMGENVAVPPAPVGEQAEEEPLAADELLVEEVSIDGMCGVY